MKLRFGEFPEDHHFLLITRPFVEGCFKFLGWLLILATLQFAYMKTESKIILTVETFFELLILGYIGAFVDWLLKFRRYRSTGNVVVGKASGATHWVIVVIATLALVGSANFIVDRAVAAFVEFQQKAK